ncbi:MAG: protein adenylyltransferase SelO, partial [Burkholderiaceae bacterium]
MPVTSERPARPADTAEPAAAGAAGLPWREGFGGLGLAFFTRLQPTPLPAPYWVDGNPVLARELGLDAWMASAQALDVLSGNTVPAGTEPLASVYSGHQFGQWAGQLGDGRAILLGELQIPDGSTREIQLKGAGLTPYSRMGDGRAVLRSSIREFLCSEAMHGLGIPTTRALALTGSDAPVRREEIETAAVVTRVAPSFLRFGHFEHFSYSGQTDQLKLLADYVIDHFYPACRSTELFSGNSYAALLEAVSERTAHLLAQWQAVGFCHGVMNTDNMSILGLTIDYGPFQFLDAFIPNHICNHSDEQGRYAYNKQPNVAYWNLFCLGQALLPLIGDQELALAALESYKTAFPRELEARMRAKMGFTDAQAGDRELIEQMLKLLAKDRVDYTIFWRRLSHFAGGASIDTVRDLFLNRE